MKRNKLSKSILYWIPRVLAVAYALFISIFALDAFSEGIPVAEAILGFLIHLTPTAILVVALAYAWKHPRNGGIAFIILGVIFTLYFNTYRNPVTLALISLPLFVIGVLFLCEKKK